MYKLSVLIKEVKESKSFGGKISKDKVWNTSPEVVVVSNSKKSVKVDVCVAKDFLDGKLSGSEVFLDDLTNNDDDIVSKIAWRNMLERPPQHVCRYWVSRAIETANATS